MKLPASLKLPVVAVATAFAAVSLHGAVDLNPNFSVFGYVVGSATYSDVDESDSSSSLDLDAMKFGGTAKFDAVTGTVSLWSGASADPIFLDMYFTYDLGGGTTVTAGKFLSWLGYEAFDPINMATYTYGWQSIPGELSIRGIPAYHTGVKIENTSGNNTLGVALLDSNNYVTPVHKGDGDLDNGIGAEAYWVYKAGDLTSFLGASYDSNDEIDVDLLGADWWVQYVSGSTTFAGEVCYTTFDQPGADADDFFWLLFVKQAVSDKFAIAGRIAGGSTDADDGEGGSTKPSYTKVSVCPIWTLSDHLEVLGELSYVSFDDVGADDGLFGALQGRFKF